MTDTPSAGLTPRHWIALTSLLNVFVALYLHLWKLGLAGVLACTSGHGCEVAQTNPTYGGFFGIDVALIGTIGYTLIFAMSLLGTTSRFVNDPRITRVLMVLIFPAFLFTLRLKYGEFIVLRTFCPWCAISAVTITLQCILVTLDSRRVRRA